jgi:hypothetical protein
MYCSLTIEPCMWYPKCFECGVEQRSFEPQNSSQLHIKAKLRCLPWAPCLLRRKWQNTRPTYASGKRSFYLASRPILFHPTMTQASCHRRALVEISTTPPKKKGDSKTVRVPVISDTSSAVGCNDSKIYRWLCRALSADRGS